ncbi:MAG: hypothetical protein IT442_09715 [Phycisphaeraceae bacterium]|nr:hypothetical protein [Phycisphaeraceae bacterium]
MLLGNPYLFQREQFTCLFDDYQTTGLFAIGTRDGRRVGICPPVFGSPMAAMYLEVLCMLGVRRIIACGYVGGLLAEAAIGSYGVPNCAIAFDGTSRAYSPTTCISHCDPALAQALVAESDRRGAQTCQGTIASIDALLLESDAMIADLQGQKCNMIDLETACLFTLATQSGVRTAAIHIVSDNPASKQIDDSRRHETSFAEQVRIAAHALMSDC